MCILQKFNVADDCHTGIENLQYHHNRSNDRDEILHKHLDCGHELWES